MCARASVCECVRVCASVCECVRVCARMRLVVTCGVSRGARMGACSTRNHFDRVAMTLLLPLLERRAQCFCAAAMMNRWMCFSAWLVAVVVVVLLLLLLLLVVVVVLLLLLLLLVVVLLLPPPP